MIGIVIVLVLVLVLVLRLDRIGSNSNYYRGCDVDDHGRISSGSSNCEYGCRGGCLYRCCDCNFAMAMAMAMTMAIVVLIVIMIE